MEKIQVNGPQSNELIQALKKATETEDIDILGNYETKFLISREGDHVERFSNAKDPQELVPFIDRLVGELETHEDDENKLVEHEKNIPHVNKSSASFVNTG
jgi:hypothetical protein